MRAIQASRAAHEGQYWFSNPARRGSEPAIPQGWQNGPQGQASQASKTLLFARTAPALTDATYVSERTVLSKCPAGRAHTFYWFDKAAPQFFKCKIAIKSSGGFWCRGIGLLLNRSPINYHVTLVFRASRALRRPKLNPNPSL